jgi:hypothetical protein
LFRSGLKNKLSETLHSATGRILGTLTGKWQRDAPFFTQSGLRTDSIFAQVRNTTVQVWTIGEGVGIGSEFSQTCCAANNFRDHDLMSHLNSLPLPDPTHAVWIGSDISPILT